MNKNIVLCFPFVGDTVGGSHISSTLLIQELIRRKYNVKVVLHRKGSLSQYFEKRGVSYELLKLNWVYGDYDKKLLNLLSVLYAFCKILLWLFGTKVKIVHVQDCRIQSMWFFPVKFLAKKFVYHQRTRISNSSLYKYIIKKADFVVFVSGFVRQQALEGCVVAVDSSVVYNPFDVSSESAGSESDELHALSVNKPYRLIWIGNYLFQKRLDLFLAIMRELIVIKGLHCMGYILGKERQYTYRDIFEILSQYTISEYVQVLGWVDEPLEYIKNADLLVSTGVNEGFGRTLVEAMSVKTAVIASNSGAHKEIIDDQLTGWLVDNDDPSVYAEKIEQILIKHAVRERVVQCAYEKVANKFSLEKHVDAMLDIYRKLLA